MSFFGLLKYNAKASLRGKWGRAAAIIIISGAVSMLMSGLEFVATQMFVIPTAASNPTMEPFDYARITRELFEYSDVEIIIMTGFMILSVVLLSPLTLGINRWYYESVHGERPSVTVMFRYFEGLRLFVRAIWFNVSLSLRTILWSLLFFMVPSAVLGVCGYFLNIEESSRQAVSIASAGTIVSIVLFLLAAILYIVFMQRYSIASYLLCEKDEVSVREAIKTSVRFSKGHRGGLILFQFSFIGWMLLVPLTLGAIVFFLVPYMNSGMMLYARYIVEKNRATRVGATHEFKPPDGNPTAWNRQQ